MKLTMIRERRAKGSIIGTLNYGDLFLCYTLENEEKAIPNGVYKMDFCMSPRFKRNLPLIYNKDVPASRGIRMHEGNTKKDSIGCILCGKNFNLSTLSLLESKKAMEMIEHLFKNNALITLEINE